MVELPGEDHVGVGVLPGAGHVVEGDLVGHPCVVDLVEGHEVVVGLGVAVPGVGHVVEVDPPLVVELLVEGHEVVVGPGEDHVGVGALLGVGHVVEVDLVAHPWAVALPVEGEGLREVVAGVLVQDLPVVDARPSACHVYDPFQTAPLDLSCLYN